jgi:hypothetical protein
MALADRLRRIENRLLPREPTGCLSCELARLNAEAVGVDAPDACRHKGRQSLADELRALDVTNEHQ